MSKSKDLFSTPIRTEVNAEGTPSYSRSLHERYLQMLLTNTFSNTFYTTTPELVKGAAELHQEMLEKDPTFMAQALIFAREVGYMRLQPIFGLTVLATVDQEHAGLFKAAFEGVIKIPSDLTDFMTILEGQGRGQGGRRVKRAVNTFLQKVNEYWGLKYNGRGRGYSLGDIIATAHPKATSDAQNNLFRYLMKKEADLAELPQILAFENLKIAKTDERIITTIEKGRLPHDVVTASAKNLSVGVWKAIMKQMPTFALLRHLNTFDRQGLLGDNEVMQYLRTRLTDAEGLKKAKILPFRFLTAFDNVTNSQVKDILRQSIELTFNNLPDLEGRTAVLLDKSGSMSGMINDGKTHRIGIGSIVGFGLYKKTNGNGLLWSFNNSVYDEEPSLVDSVLTQAQRIRAHGGTTCAAPIATLTERKEKVDTIIMITDEQENNYYNGSLGYGSGKSNGTLMFEALKEYRSKVNPDVKAFIINIAPEEGSLVPISDKNTFYIYGWSDQVLKYISEASKGFGTLVDQVKSTPIALD